ncbi:MAG: hypothetical protein ACRCZB_03325 [Bacteroidales bacterium]
MEISNKNLQLIEEALHCYLLQCQQREREHAIQQEACYYMPKDFQETCQKLTSVYAYKVQDLNQLIFDLGEQKKQQLQKDD